MDSSILVIFLLSCLGLLSRIESIRHGKNLIWAQIPSVRMTVSRLVGIEGDPNDWVPSGKVKVRHISAPHFGWEFKALAFQYSTQTLLWSEAMNKRIQSLVLNGSTDTQDVFSGTSPEVYGMAVDWMSGNLYWADALYNWIIMAPLDPQERTYRLIIQDGLDSPHGVAVYPKKGYLLWTDWGERPKIEISDLLGNNRRILVEDSIKHPRGLTIDYDENQLYWVDSEKDSVEAVSLNGMDRRVVAVQDGSNFFGLALYGKYLFVTEQSKGHLKIFDKKKGTNYISYRLGYIPYGIIMYDGGLQEGDSSECDALNCDQMCVFDAIAGPTCICGEGYRTADDGITCDLGKSFVQPSHIYAIHDAICHYPANIADMSLTNVSLDTQCFLDDRHGYLALSYDARDNRLYYSENNTGTISRIQLEIGATAQTIVGGTGIVKGLALDWVAGNLYWTESTNKLIKVARKDGTYQKVLFDENLENPLGIAVHPGRSRVYWTDPGTKPKVESSYMDGSNRTVIMADNLGSPNHVFIDYVKDILYWADSVLHHIRSYDLNTGRISVIFTQENTGFYGISLFKDYLLWTDTEQMNGIHVARLDKDEKVRGIIHPAYGIAQDLITYDIVNQPMYNSSCKESENDCEQLCLNGDLDSFWCQCGLGYELTEDDKTCRAGNIQNNFLLVTDAYQKQVFQVNSVNGVVHAIHHSIMHSPIAVGFDPMYRRIYWSDNTAHIIKGANLDGLSSQIVLGMAEEAETDGLAIDYINRLLYYTDAELNVIGVVSLKNYTLHKTLITKNLDQPRAIVLLPLEGRMYWTDWGVQPRIETANMDGSDRSIFLNLDKHSWPNGLALDHKDRKLYWADAQFNTINMITLNGTEKRILHKGDYGHFFGLTQMGDYLYVTDWKKTYISRIHKNGGSLERFGTNSFNKLYGIYGFNSTEILRGTSVCDKNDCQQICIPVPHNRYVCECRNGFELLTDARSCVHVPTTRAPTTTYPATRTPSQTPTRQSTSANVATTAGRLRTSLKRMSSSATTRSSSVTKSATSLGTQGTTFRTTVKPSSSANTIKMLSSPESPKTEQPSTISSQSVSVSGLTDYVIASTATVSAFSSSTVGKFYTPAVATSKKGSGGLSRGVIVVVVIVVILVSAAAVIIAVVLYRKHKRMKIPHGKLVEDDNKVDSFYRITFPENNKDEPIVDCGIENPTYDCVSDDDERTAFT